jgi:hypothetical protein
MATMRSSGVRARNLKDEEINLAINSTRVWRSETVEFDDGCVRLILFYGHKNRCPFVLGKHDEELRGLVLTGVSTDCMNVPRSFVESFPRSKRYFLSTLHLHHNRPLKNVHESLGVVPMLDI